MPETPFVYSAFSFMIFPVVRKLLEVQDRDQRANSLRKTLKEIPVLKKRAESRLADDEAQVNAEHVHVREVELRIKTLQLDVQTRRTSIVRLKDQQFATRKNEEFRAMANEITRYEKDVHDLEDKELELMEELESVKPAWHAAQKALEETKKSIAADLKELDERAEAIEARLIELKGERAALIEPIDTTDLALYDRIMKSKGDAAIVLLENGICKGCHVRVVTGTIQKLRANTEITLCEQCGRILYSE